MLNSLLSLYFAGSISPSTPAEIEAKIEPNAQIVEISDFKISNLIAPEIKPVKNPEMIAPVIDAKASISIDFSSGSTLHEKNAHQRLPIASITKLMTILLVLEESALNEVVTVSQNAASIEGSSMNLIPGEEITVSNLLKAVLIHSANDGATALAEHNAGSVEAFVTKMNERALQLGLVNTHYSNPTGLDHPDNYSSAYDVAKLSKFVYDKDFVKNTAPIAATTVHSVDQSRSHNLEATNKLLDSYLDIRGLKTGRTAAAGECFSGIAVNEHGNEIITVVLNSPGRFKETKILVDWSFRAYNWPHN